MLEVIIKYINRISLKVSTKPCSSLVRTRDFLLFPHKAKRTNWHSRELIILLQDVLQTQSL